MSRSLGNGYGSVQATVQCPGVWYPRRVAAPNIPVELDGRDATVLLLHVRVPSVCNEGSVDSEFDFFPRVLKLLPARVAIFESRAVWTGISSQACVCREEKPATVTAGQLCRSLRAPLFLILVCPLSLTITFQTVRLATAVAPADACTKREGQGQPLWRRSLSNNMGVNNNRRTLATEVNNNMG